MIVNRDALSDDHVLTVTVRLGDAEAWAVQGRALYGITLRDWVKAACVEKWERDSAAFACPHRDGCDCAACTAGWTPG